MMKTRNLCVAISAIAFLIIGAVVVPVHVSNPTDAALAARFASATRSAQAANGSGYWLVTADGKVMAFGGAQLYGSMIGKQLTAPITGIVPTKTGRGYWLVAEDGGVFAFGDAVFSGSLGGKILSAGVVGMASSSATSGVGPRGLQGARGAKGLAGARGANGAVGTPGLAGPQGSAGAAGTNGTNGTAGAAGGTGPQGPAGGANHAYVYNTSAQTVPIETAIDFNSNGPLSGFTHNTGFPGIVAVATDTYRVNFSVSGVEPNQFALFVNGTVNTSSIYGSGAGTQVNYGEAILSLAGGDVLTLVNHSSAAAVTLQTLAGGTQNNVNAAIFIEQLG